MKIRRPGEIWLADLGIAAKMRPVLIVSREDRNPPRVLYIYVPLTTQNRGSDYEVELGRLRFLNQDSIVNVQGIGSLIDQRFGKKLGSISSAKLEEVRQAIRYALEL